MAIGKIKINHTILLVIGFLFLSYTSHAQRHGIGVGAGMESTAVGIMYSYYLNLEMNRHEIGVLMQSRFNRVNSDFNSPYHFKGMYYQFTFYREKHLYTSVGLRGGLVNDQFVVIAPNLSVGYIFNDYVKVALLCSARFHAPSIGINVFVNLPFKSHEYTNSIHRK